MPELSDAHILEIIGCLPGFTCTDEDAAGAVACVRQAVTYLPYNPHCCIEDVVPFVTALAYALTSVPKYDSQLPLECRLAAGYVRQNTVAEAAGDIMAMTERGGVRSSGAKMALDIALTRDLLRERLSPFEADRMDPEVYATITGRHRFPIDPPPVGLSVAPPDPAAVTTSGPVTTLALAEVSVRTADDPALVTCKPRPQHPPAIHRHAMILLEVLATAPAGHAMMRVDIAAASAERDGLRGEKAVGERLNGLIELKLVEKPCGRSGGYAISDAGRDRLANVRRIPD